MMNNAQELRVTEPGTVGNVRIIDEAAVSGGPIAPKSIQILLGSAFLDTILVSGLVTGRRLEHRGARVTGLILNNYGARQVGRTYQTYYHRYDYRSQKKGKA